MRSDSRVTVRCAGCNATRRIYTRAGKSLPTFCRPCDLARRSGARNGRWKGGVTPLNQTLRRSPEYKVWRSTVFERDKFTCVWCGNRGSLHADHIKPFSSHPEARLDVANGRTLCIDCHKKTPTYLGGAMKGRYSRRDPKTRQTGCSKCGRTYDLWNKRGWPICRACKNKNWLRRHHEKQLADRLLYGAVAHGVSLPV